MFAVTKLRTLGRDGWLLAIAGLILGFLFQAACQWSIISLCGPSDYENILNSKMKIAILADLLILARIILGLCHNEKGIGWVFYAVLPWLMVPIIEIGIKIRYAGYSGCSGC